jgi:acetyltransferase
LFGAAETLATAKPVYSNRLTLLSNSYSLALLTSDTLLRHGGHLAEISEATRLQLARDCRPDYPIENPVDLGDMAGSRMQYGKALDLLLHEPGTDGVLVIHAPASVDRSWTAPRWWSNAAKSRRLDHDLLGGRSVGGSGAGAVSRMRIFLLMNRPAMRWKRLCGWRSTGAIRNC